MEEDLDKFRKLSRDQQYAYIDFRKWTKILKDDINKWLKMTSREGNSSVLRLKSDDRLSDQLLRDAVHWYLSLESGGFNKTARKAISTATDKELKETVQNLRNLREHWENARQYFYAKEERSIKANKYTKAVIWFKKKTDELNKKNFKKLTPTTLVFPGYWEGENPPEALIAGIFAPRKLLTEIKKIETAVDKYTKERPYLKGKIRIRF